MTQTKTALQDMPGEIWAKLNPFTEGKELKNGVWASQKAMYSNPVKYVLADLAPRLTDEELKAVEDIMKLSNQITLHFDTQAGLARTPTTDEVLVYLAARGQLRRATQADKGE